VNKAVVFKETSPSASVTTQQPPVASEEGGQAATEAAGEFVWMTGASSGRGWVVWVCLCVGGRG
jgi:hypothetical protein